LLQHFGNLNARQSVMRHIGILAFALIQTLVAADTDRAAAWRLLDESLHDGSSDRRQEALAALSTLGSPDPEAVQRTVAALHDKDLFVRRAAALALGDMKATSAIEELKQALDDSPEVAFAAAKALTQLGDAGGRDVLVAVMVGEKKETPGMFTNAMRIAKYKLKHPEGLILMGSEDAAGAMFGPASMVIPAVKDTADLKSKGTPGRAAAVAYLAKYPDPYAIELLEWALEDDNQFVRLEAAKGLGERGNAASIQKLQGLWLDKRNIVRDMAAASIIRILDRNGTPGEIMAGPVPQPKTDKK